MPEALQQQELCHGDGFTYKLCERACTCRLNITQVTENMMWLASMVLGKQLLYKTTCSEYFPVLLLGYISFKLKILRNSFTREMTKVILFLKSSYFVPL